MLAYSIEGIPSVLLLLLLHQPAQLAASLGLSKDFFKGLLAAFIFTLPMLLGYAVVFAYNDQLTWQEVIIGSVCAAFFEELYFRGILFGQLFRYGKIGFFPAILLGAVLFALAHLHQSNDPAELVGIFGATFVGAILFAWVYAEWDNLWVPIFLHLLMNLYWGLFSAGDNAMGGNEANLFRLLTIALAIGGTIIYKRKKKLALAVNKRTIWKKHS